MKIYKINNFNDYLKVVKLTLTEGSVDHMGEKVPLFNEALNLIEFFAMSDDDVTDLYDDVGKPLWDIKKYPLPEDWLNMTLKLRLESFKLQWPFYIVIDGHSGWNRVGYNDSKTFFECCDIQEV